MAYAIIRTKRIREHQINQVFMHNLRVDLKYAKHTDPTKTDQNEVLIDSWGLSAGLGNFADKWEEGIKKTGVQVGKKNTVKMLEFVLTASPEFFQNATPAQVKQWEKAQKEFAKKEFGENLKFMVVHKDEKTPHIHLCVLPAVKKVHKYKNQKGEFFKEKHTLSPNDFNPKYLAELQTRYAESNKGFGLNRGLKRSKANHKTLKEYYENIDQAMKKDYTKGVKKEVQKIFEENAKGGFFGGQPKFTINEILEKLTPIFARNEKIIKSVRVLKQNLHSDNIKEVNDLLMQKEDIKNLRNEYFEAIETKKTDVQIIKNLTTELEALKEKHKKPIVQSVQLEQNIDKKLKIR